MPPAQNVKKIQATSLQNDMHDPILTRLISTKITTYRGHVASHFVVLIGGGNQEASSQAMCLPNSESGPSLQNELAYDVTTKSMFSSNVSTQRWKRPIITKRVGLWYVYKKACSQAMCEPTPIRAHLYKMICPPDISTKSILSSIYSNQDFLQNGCPSLRFSHAWVILGEEIFPTKWLPQRHYRESTFQEKPRKNRPLQNQSFIEGPAPPIL